MLLNTIDWPAYIRAMEQLLNVPMDEMRRKEIEIQLTRMAELAEPLMEFPLPQREEVAGVYKL
ncbi:oxalurate catabolism protein HpxX [Enterobacteriaceae bacterium RIT711]|nr:oxalurate catabolism protein HpxX [Enterobacteriaceae bacterium RIT711]